MVRQDGYYSKAMPWRNSPSVPNKKSMALARLQGLRRRLDKNSDLLQKYTVVMEENIQSVMLEKWTLVTIKVKFRIFPIRPSLIPENLSRRVPPKKLNEL